MEVAVRKVDTYIEQMLNDVRRSIASDRAERFRQGKEFNIFRVQRILNDEVKICRLIRELLDPRQCFSPTVSGDFRMGKDSADCGRGL